MIGVLCGETRERKITSQLQPSTRPRASKLRLETRRKCAHDRSSPNERSQKTKESLVVKAELTELADRLSTISREEILARLRDRALAIVDVMPRETFADGHIPGAINLPVADVETTASKLLANLAQEIAIYCAGPT